jgi:phosphatidate cytidylyltransferase
MTRVLSGVALAAAALAAILFLPSIGVRLLACAVAAVAAWEYLGILHRDRREPGATPVLMLVVLACWWMSDPDDTRLLTLTLLSMIWVVIDVLFRGLPVTSAAGRVFALWYVGMPLGMVAAVHARAGAMPTLLLMATVAVSDTAQFYSGRLFGRRPLAPAISPHKTIEGALGGLTVGTLFVVLAGARAFPERTRVSFALLGVAVVVLGICGDLFESRLKRTAGVKDSADIIPGHGGVLDRIDALLFAAPAFFLYVEAYG